MINKTTASLIVILTIVAAAMFAGCVEKEPSTPTSTSLAPTPTPTLSVTIEDIEEEIELLVKELGYDNEVSQYVAHELNGWTDKQGNPILQEWKGELRDARERYEEGKLSIDKLTDIEIKITKELGQKIKDKIPDYNEDIWHLENVIRDKVANCFGYTQLLFVLGTAIELSVVPIDVREEIGYIRGDHSACLINLSDARKMILVDLVSSPILVSKPFIFERKYEKIGNYFELIDKDSLIILHPRFRICDEDVLIAGIINSRGITYAGLGEYQRAISNFTEAIEIDQKYAHAYYNRGNAYYELREYQKAILDYTKAIELDPKYAEACDNRGNAYVALGDYQMAIPDYTKAIELDPKDAEAYYNRGLAYADLEEYQMAISDYTKAIEIDQKYAGAYCNRGFAYYKLEDYQMAISDYTKAIELDPKHAGTYVRRGTAYLILSETQKAQRDFDMATSLDPELEGVVQKILDLFSIGG